MAEIVNFRRAKKAKARSAKEEKAAANRAKFGTSKAERRLGEAREEKAARDVEAHRLNDTDDG